MYMLWDAWQQQNFDTLRALLALGGIHKKTPLLTSIPIFKQEAKNERILRFVQQDGNMKHI